MKPPIVGEADAPLLRITDFKTTFATGDELVHALNGVSLTLERGRTLGVVGESGSGKTVLARSIMGLFPGAAAMQSGQVEFCGRNLVGLPHRELAKLWGAELAMVFQDPGTSLSPVLRIGRQITDVMRHHLKLSRRDAAQHALKLLQSVGIPDAERCIAEYPHQLSGGMRQRVVIAIALACAPQLLLADEPTTALDVTIQSQILDLLAREQAERQMGMILVSHDLGVVADRTQEIAVMYAGRIVERAPTQTLFANPRMPYTRALMASIPRLTDVPHSPLETIQGSPPDLRRLPGGCPFAPRCQQARDRCWSERPPLQEEVPGHAFSCWYPVGRSTGSGSRHQPAASVGSVASAACPKTRAPDSPKRYGASGATAHLPLGLRRLPDSLLEDGSL